MKKVFLFLMMLLSCTVMYADEITGTTTLTGNARIRVCEGGTLVVDGGTIQNADITMVPGSTVILRNGGKINMASGKDFDAPNGVTVNLESGEIQ